MLIKSLSIVAFFAFCINVFLAGLDRGYDYHSRMYGLSGSGFAGDFYFYNGFFLLVYILSKTAKKRLLSNIICLAALSFTIYQYKNIYFYKKLLSDAGEPLSLMFRESIPLDVLSFTLVIVLLIAQLITVFQYYFEWKRNNTEIK